LWISWLSLILANDPPSERWLSPYVAAPLNLVGALMMLYGGGQWGRWAYLWVFVSVPIVVSPLALLSAAHPALDFMFAKPLALVVFASPMVVSYLLVKRYYRRRDRQNLGQQS
jgi:membrane protein implicated in regulation of membrane protease activity